MIMISSPRVSPPDYSALSPIPGCYTRCGSWRYESTTGTSPGAVDRELTTGRNDIDADF